jgi:hypothetical protein
MTQFTKEDKALLSEAIEDMISNEKYMKSVCEICGDDSGANAHDEKAKKLDELNDKVWQEL